MKKYIQYIAPMAFILLWGSAAFLKLWNWQESQSEMKLQLFPYSIGAILWWILPLIHIFIVFLLLDNRKQELGMKISTILTSIYTLYLLIGFSKLFGKTPCACAGLWPTNQLWIHILLNSIFIAMGIIYWRLALRSKAVEDVSTDLCRKEGAIF